MARALNKLPAKRVENASYEGRTLKLADGGGLYLLVNASGKYWRLKYRIDGREKLMSLGVFPDTSLAEAREHRDKARKLIRNGVDPVEQRRAEKAPAPEPETFEQVAREWLELQKKKMAERTYTAAEQRLRDWAFPHIGDTPIGSLEPPHVLQLLRRIEAKELHETAHRVRQRISQVCRYAIATGRAARDPTADLKGALAPVPTQNRAALTDPASVGPLMRAIRAYEGQPATRGALQLLALTFVRPSELRRAKWSEFDLDAARWRLPAERMKMKREHLVPLSDQALAVLRAMQPHADESGFVFPSVRRGRPLSENTLNMALRTMGYSGDQMTSHGFRAMASTLLHELGWPPEVIELQLAHAQRSQVAAAYNRSARLDERRRMMQHWADYLDQLRSGESNVVPIQRAQGV